ncbi:MAG: glycoside hydrolase family 105 protein [Aestuariibaculum sp.]
MTLLKSLTYILVFCFSLFCLCCKTDNGHRTEKAALPNSNILCIDKKDVKSILDKVAHWQMENLSYSTTKNLHDNGIGSWTNATFYQGLMAWAKANHNDSTYLKWLNNIGRETKWQVSSNFKDYPKYQLYHADEFCIAQMYLEAYQIYKDEQMKASVKDRVNWVLNHPGNADMSHKNKQSWTWCDALFMAPPVYAHLAQIENNETYLHFMDTEFKRTYKYLYSVEDKLFFRDDSYFDKKENNGEKIFWGRGNGWVAAGLANILKHLPENSEYRPFYENLFKTFIPKLASLQSKQGFWHASLLDTESYPAPEASATALITYAMAYGINHNLLDGTEYCPIVNKSWEALMSIINNKGKLGWVQPIGADPKKVTANMTASYGVGALLLAGSEIYNMDIENSKKMAKQ